MLQSAGTPRRDVETARSEPAATPHSVTVHSQIDPQHPGRTAYRISGPTKGSVQDEIDKLFATVDRHDVYGFAQFVGPHRLGFGYVALGEVVVSVPA